MKSVRHFGFFFPFVLKKDSGLRCLRQSTISHSSSSTQEPRELLQLTAFNNFSAKESMKAQCYYAMCIILCSKIIHIVLKVWTSNSVANTAVMYLISIVKTQCPDVFSFHGWYLCNILIKLINNTRDRSFRDYILNSTFTGLIQCTRVCARHWSCIDMFESAVCSSLHKHSMCVHVCWAVRVSGGREAVNQPPLASHSFSKGMCQKATTECERQHLDYIFHQNNRRYPGRAAGSSPTI